MSQTSPTPPSPPDDRHTLGHLAELLVARWLMQQGHELLHRRWHCRWGELDLVALEPATATTSASVIFVEVKARRDRNWDETGLLAITTQKQTKLWQAASLFLSTFPELAPLPCRFDVALLSAQNRPKLRAKSSDAEAAETLPGVEIPGVEIQLGQRVAIAHYHLTLQHYLKNAFEL